MRGKAAREPHEMQPDTPAVEQCGFEWGDLEPCKSSGDYHTCRWRKTAHMDVSNGRGVRMHKCMCDESYLERLQVIIPSREFL